MKNILFHFQSLEYKQKLLGKFDDIICYKVNGR